MALKTDYKDDILDSSVNVNRTFSIIDNTTGQIIYPNVSLEETTVFSQEGDSHTSQITNEQNTEINQINASLTVGIVGSQIGTGSKTVTTSKQIIRCITKKSGVIVETKEIPTSVLESGDVVLLGNTSPVVGSEDVSTGTPQANMVGGKITAYRMSSNPWPLNLIGNGNALNQANTIGLATDLSQSTGASITYNGSNSFTITVTDSTLSVYLCA